MSDTRRIVEDFRTNVFSTIELCHRHSEELNRVLRQIEQIDTTKEGFPDDFIELATPLETVSFIGFFF